MKKVKVTIQDENTLVLQEDAQKGDLIDLKSLHETDIDKSTITSVVKSIKMDEFNAELEKAKTTIKKENELQLQLKEKEINEKANKELIAKEKEISELKSSLNNAELRKKLEISEALTSLEKERDKLTNELKNKENEGKLNETTLKREFELKLKSKDEEIALYKDMKTKLSTKMLGESLEQHCEIEFNKIRSTAFPKAYFEKDNDASDGTKGDYVYREATESGIDVLSIMFEMKNEGDETATKKKNEDFLAKLDKDRNDKKCEFAVLVSLLEIDNELYNSGIVDMSHKYPKMYVIRPQFFILLITLLRNAALKSLEFKSELALVRSQNIDITNFEKNMEIFKEGFARNYDLASRKFSDAIDGIDKTIKQLEKTKAALLSSENNYRLANNKAQDLTIKQLTKNSPTMEEAFKRIRNDK